MEKVKNVLALSSKEAIEYFMNADQYSTFELPEYFKFQPVLDYVRKKSVGTDICEGASDRQSNHAETDVGISL